MKKLIPLLSLLLLLAACNKEKEDLRSIVPPIAELDIAFQNFKVSNKGDTLISENGSRIIIPSGALVDSTGKPLENTSIQFREFTDALDIFLSGIPMTFNSMGKEEQMITGGMFEIRANQAENKSIFIDPKKEIQLKFASKQTILNHDFFGFNEENQKWEYINSPKNEINPELEKIKNNIVSLQPKIKFPLEKEYFALNYWQAIDVIAESLDMSYYKNEKKSKLKFQEYGFKTYAIQNWDYINYKGKKELAQLFLWKNLSGSKIPSWVEKCYYNESKFTQIRGERFKFEAQKEGKKYVATFERIMPLWALFKFPPDYWEKNHQEALAKIEEEEKRLETEAKVFRSFSINQFGIYNFDVLLKATMHKVPADFTLVNSDDKNQNELFQMNKVFIIFANNSSVLTLKKSQWKDFSFIPEYKDFTIFSILPNNKIAIYPREKFEKINIDSLIQQENPKVNFILEPEENQPKSKADLKKLLNL